MVAAYTELNTGSFLRAYFTLSLVIGRGSSCAPMVHHRFLERVIVWKGHLHCYATLYFCAQWSNHGWQGTERNAAFGLTPSPEFPFPD